MSEERLKRRLPLWQLAASVPFPVANLHRIEAGLTEPRIGLAMSMLSALGVDTGIFMQTLAETQAWKKIPVSEGFSAEILTVANEKIGSEYGGTAMRPGRLFGAFFRIVRLACGLTQAQIASRSNYTTRSLIAVENGKQEPMVMRALELVWVTGVDVSEFFGYYSLSLMNMPRIFKEAMGHICPANRRIVTDFSPH